MMVDLHVVRTKGIGVVDLHNSLKNSKRKLSTLDQIESNNIKRVIVTVTCKKVYKFPVKCKKGKKLKSTGNKKRIQ